MKRVFSVELRKIGGGYLEGSRSFEVVTDHAKNAIDKATTRFKKDENWRGGVLVESLRHRGPAV